MAEDEQRIHIVDVLHQKMSEGAKERWALISKMPCKLPSSCKVLWGETSASFTFSLNSAALTLCGAFVEHFLETAIPAFQMNQGQSPQKLPTTLQALISLAVSIGLVSQRDGELLHDFRYFVRNKFAHGDINGIADSLFAIRGVTEVVVQGGKVVSTSSFTDDDLATMQAESAGERFQSAQKMYAERVIPWVGKWARDTAIKVWGDTTPQTPNKPTAPERT